MMANMYEELIINISKKVEQRMPLLKGFLLNLAAYKRGASIELAQFFIVKVYFKMSHSKLKLTTEKVMPDVNISKEYL